MKIEVSRRFEKDASNLSDQVQQQLFEVIDEIELADTLSDLRNVKKLKGYKYAFRIKMGDYRIGLLKSIDDTIVLSRILHRKDIYNFFPQ
jgi:mRNA interferase RelE/StbE